MAIKQTYKPLSPINIGVNKDTVNDMARKLNLEIENIYDILNLYQQRKFAFSKTSNLWQTKNGASTLSFVHNGNTAYAVFRVDNGVESQVFASLKRDNTNIVVEANAPFDGYILLLSERDDLSPSSGDRENRPTNVAVGQMYFDTTFGKPIWYKGSGKWVDATGAEV